MMLFSSLAFLLTAFVAVDVHAFWRLPCGAPVTVERIDPLVTPGKVSGHVHTVMGSSTAHVDVTFEQLRESECTSCLAIQDKSLYWAPTLYFAWANGSFSSVKQVGGALIYYLDRRHSSDATEVLAFPDGFRMLTGDPFKRSYDGSQTAQAIGWNCLGGAQPTRKPELPSGNCPNGLRAEIRFPSCWNGVELDTDDHHSHVAYSDGESGPCPAAFPKRIETLFYEILWDVDAFEQHRPQALDPDSPFVLSDGDASGGYSLHGDFINGWDHDVLQEAIRTCTYDSGVIEECKIFDLYPSGHECHTTPNVDEIVLGTLDKLPGNNPLTTGPDRAPVLADSDPPTLFSNPTAYTGKAPPPGVEVLANQPRVLEGFSGWVYDDCYSDLVDGRALPNGLRTENDTVEACLLACSEASYSLCGIEYHGECWGANELTGGSEALGYGYCDLTCNDNPLQYCGGGYPTAMELYRFASGNLGVVTDGPSATPISSSSSKPSAAATSATAVGSAPQPSAAVGKANDVAGWEYSGCSSDLVGGGRSLPNGLSSDGTATRCLAECTTAGYAVCGVSYGGECYGGAALSPKSHALKESDCQMSCSSDSSMTCGGSAALDVYLSTVIDPLTEPTSPNLAEIEGYSYTGCWSDLVNNTRSLPKRLSTGNETIEDCVTACTEAGLDTCGLSFYGECWAGSALASTSEQLDELQCSTPCRDNPLEMCGGAGTLSVYAKQDVPVSSSQHTRFVRANIRHQLSRMRRAFRRPRPV